MQYRNEGNSKVFDVNPRGQDIVLVRNADKRTWTFSGKKLFPHQEPDLILPGPIERGVDSSNNSYHILFHGNKVYLHYMGKVFSFVREERDLEESGQYSLEIRSPMPGKILQIHKTVGDSFEKGETLGILEAMKMENQLKSPCKGKVTALHFSEGDLVHQDAVVFELEEE